MKSMDMRILTAGILFILIIASGFWTTKSGRPLNTAIFTLHKLTALATLVLLIFIVRALAGGIIMNPLMIISTILNFIFFITMFATGAVLSFEKPAPDIVRLIHKALPYMTFVAAVTTVFLLKKL